MRAPTIVITAVASLSLAACGSIRTVNGIETDSARSFCERRIVTCVMVGSAIVIAAGIGVGLATGAANAGRKDRNLAAFAAAASAPNQFGGNAASAAVVTTNPVTTAAPVTTATIPTADAVDAGP